jgi:amino acid permease
MANCKKIIICEISARLQGIFFFRKTLCTMAEMLRDQLQYQAPFSFYTNIGAIICYLAIFSKFIWRKFFKKSQQNNSSKKLDFYNILLLFFYIRYFPSGFASAQGDWTDFMRANFDVDYWHSVLRNFYHLFLCVGSH